MPTLVSNGINLAYEDHGSAADPVILMVQGLGMPLTAWPPALIDALVDDNFRVITFDNRDVGESQVLSELQVPNLLVQMLRRTFRLRVRVPYQLSDMMRDAEGVLDALSLDAAHVVGVSMGGMISQLLAINAPARVKSLTSIMSTTGDRKLPGPRRAVRRHILRRPNGASYDDRLAYHRKTWNLIGSPGFPRTEQETDDFLRRIFDRGMTPDGTLRQMLAVVAAPSRAPELRKLDVPTLVIHGDADPLVPVACGHHTARAIPNSRIVTIPGMGHDLPATLVPRFATMIAQHVGMAEA